MELWLQDVAPSTPLRQGYGHDPAPVAAVRERSRHAVAVQPGRAARDQGRELARTGPVTLVVGARAVERSEATVVQEVLTHPTPVAP